MHHQTRRAVAVLLACLCAFALFVYARGQGGSPLQQSVARAEKLVAALNLYVQDWDGTFPPMKTQPQFQVALKNYVANPSLFICPITKQPFQPNSALSGKTTAFVSDYGSTSAVQAAIPKQATLVAYLDGHVQQGQTDLTDPTAESVQNAKMVAQGLLSYTQDWDEVVPPVRTPAQLQQALSPYVRDLHAFVCPLSGKAFQLNPQLSGGSLAAIADFGATPAIWDTPAQPNSQSVVGYLDLHVERGGMDLSNLVMESNEHVHTLIFGLDAYAQDYDEVLPPMQNAAAFKQAVYPYVRSERVFLSPFSQQLYLPNSALSGKPINSIKDYSTVFGVKDPVPGPGKQITIGYMDGYITRGGVDQGDPTYETTSHARMLMTALQFYLQDYNGVLPPMATYAQFRAALFPYVRASRAFTCPYTHTVFAINTALNGHSLSDFSDPSTVVVIRDPGPERDGRPTIGYLDDHVTPNRLIPRP